MLWVYSSLVLSLDLSSAAPVLIPWKVHRTDLWLCLLEKPAASSLHCLSHLGAAPLLVRLLLCCAVVTLDSWLLFLSSTWLLLLKKQQAGLENWKSWLYISWARLMQGMQCCSESIIFMTVGSRGSCHFSSFLHEALSMESARKFHKTVLSQEIMWMLGVWRRKQGSDLPVLQRKCSFWKEKNESSACQGSCIFHH